MSEDGSIPSLDLKAEYYMRDHEMEPGVNHVGRQKYASSMTRGMWTKVYPNSSASITVASTAASSSYIFNLPRSGYYCNFPGQSGCLEIVLTPSAACQVEPYASVFRFDQTYNQTITTAKYNHAYRAACAEVLDTPLQNLCIGGAMFGAATQFNQYEPFVNSTVSTQAVATSGATAAAAPNYLTTSGGTFLIPFTILADGILRDPNSLLPICNLNQNQIEISFLGTQSWVSSVNATPAAITMTISNPILYISRTTVSKELNALYNSLIADNRLAIHTQIKVTQGFTQTVLPSTTDTNIQFTALPGLMQFLEVYPESSTARSNIGCAYKGLTTPRCGISAYRMFLDNVPVTDKLVEVAKFEAYHLTNQTRVARLKSLYDVERLDCPAYSPYIHSGIGSSVSSAYPSSDLDSAGSNYCVYNSAFRMSANLGSVNPLWYSGAKARILDLSIQTDATQSYYNTGASTQTAISAGVSFIMVCHAPARLVLGLGNAVFES